MLKRSLIVFIVTWSLALCGSMTAAKEAATLRFSMPENLRVGTVMAQRILLQAYAKIGVKINFVPLPAARSTLMWEDGRLDGLTYRLIDTELANGIQLKTPISYGDVVAFSIKERFQVAGYDSLRPYKVGYIAGVPFLLEKLKNVPVKESAPSIESLFRKLELGRSDVVVDSRFSLCFAEKLGIANVMILEPALERSFGHHYLHMRHQHLVEPLEKALQSMERDGSIKKLQDEAVRDFMLRCEPK